MKKTFIFLPAIFFLLLLLLSLLFFFLPRMNRKETDLACAVSAYQQSADSTELELLTAADRLSVPVDSGEAYFLEGIHAYSLGDYETAKTCFLQALDSPFQEPSLPAYLYYYTNQCDYFLTGTGSPETISLALEAIRSYPPLSSNTSMLWDLLDSISLSESYEQEAIPLLQQHLDLSRDLDLATWAWIENYLAMMEYQNKEYAKSIRRLYDVQLALEGLSLTPELEQELLYAKEYIANIYMIFQDYENAVTLYQEVLHHTADQVPYSSYVACINMASAYLELEDPAHARRAIQELDEHIPHLNMDIVEEVRASMNDVLANIAMAEGDYAMADHFLTLAESFYSPVSYSDTSTFSDRDSVETGNLSSEAANPNSAFIGGQYFIHLSRCKYLYHVGNGALAAPVLEHMLSSGSAAYCGIEKDVYELLADIYQETRQSEDLIRIYQQLILLDEAFVRTIQREYLEFSSYYQENNQLKQTNVQLSRKNFISIILIFLISLILLSSILFIGILHKKNITDALTGVYNRQKLSKLTKAWRWHGPPDNLGVILMDIDFFKYYNDTYGHPAGDEALKEVARLLMSCIRRKDTVIRYGGEEFLLLLHEVSEASAEAICQRIRSVIKTRAIPHEASQVSDCITLSMGLCYQEKNSRHSLAELIDIADQCLYQSKTDGRDRLTIQTMTETHTKASQ